MERRDFIRGATAAAVVGMLVPIEQASAVTEPVDYPIWPPPADPIQARYLAFFTQTYAMTGGRPFEDHDISIRARDDLDYQGSAIGFQCLVTSSHPRVHAAPKFLVKAGSTVAVPIERIRHDYYRWMRIRFSTHDGSPIRSGWVVRVNVQLLGHWY